MPIKLVVALSTPVKIILALGSVAGGGLAAWKLTQEIVESEKFGPPAWWVTWRRPLKPAAPVTKPELSLLNRHATMIFRWDRDRWCSLSRFLYSTARSKILLKGGPPVERYLYAQAWWYNDGKKWVLKSVGYARDVNLPPTP